MSYRVMREAGLPNQPVVERGKTNLSQTVGVKEVRLPRLGDTRPSMQRSAPPPTATPLDAVVPEQPGPAGVAPAVVEVPVAVPTAGVVGLRRGVFGIVRLLGSPPPERPLPIDPRDPTCGKLHKEIPKTRFYAVGTNGVLADVFVHVTSGLADAPHTPPETAVVLDQAGCEYVPYFTGLQTGQMLQVRNSDPFTHNVHVTPMAAGNKESNRAQMPKAVFTYAFPSPEVFLRIKCDMHPWMFAYVGVVNHRFHSVSDAQGEYVLQDLPPGRYTIEAVHRKAGKLTREVEVGASVPVQVDFEFELEESAAE
jgi:plastocyanin